MSVADDLNRDEDVDCQKDDERDQQEQKPAQLFLVFHKGTTNIIIMLGISGWV